MPVKIGGSYVTEAAVSFAKAQDDKSNSNVLKNLSEKFPNIKFTVGTKPFSSMGTNNVSISPKILKQMENDPEKRMEYEALIYDIAHTDLKQGRNLKSGGFIIDDKGGLSAWSVSEHNDGNRRNVTGLNRNNKKDWFDKMLGNAPKKKKKEDKTKAAVLDISDKGKVLASIGKNVDFKDTDELSKYIFQNYNVVKSGMTSISAKYLRDCIKDEDKLKSLFDNLSAADAALKEKQGEIGFQGMKVKIDENGEVTMESSKSTIGFNGAKLKRQMATAATKGDMKTVMALIEQDVQALEDGLKNNMCDVAEVEKAKKLLEEAQQKMAKLPDRASTPEEKVIMAVNAV